MQVICPTWWIVAMHSKADCLTRRLAWIKLGETAEQTCNKSNSWLGNFKSATMTKFTTSSLILAFFWNNSGNKISMTIWGVQTFINIFITRIHSILICTLESRVKKFVFSQLSDSQIVSPESSWDNNHYSVDSIKRTVLLKVLSLLSILFSTVQ